MNGKETSPSRPPNPAFPYREDCWSEGATSTLIDEWGDRYVELNRGSLRQNHWQEVADAVNSRRGGVKKPPRTHVQCKNRIDTLKKKYKVEKARVSDSNGALTSQWPFYYRLDALIGNSVAVKKPSPPLALPLPYHRKSSPLPAAAAVVRPPGAREKRTATALPVDNSFFRRNYSAAAAAAAAEEDGDSEWSRSSRSSRERSGKGWMGREGEGDGIRELARTILRFGEIYERVEGAKQRQMIELEKQRMEFTKGLEFQRMQFFVDSQVQLQKMKRTKRGDAESSYL